MKHRITFDDGSSAYLAHHGILGMKWGVRNAETLERYRRDGLTLTRHPKNYTVSGHEALYFQDDSEATQREFSRLRASSSELMNRYNDMWNTADSELKRLSKDPKVRKEALSELKKDFVSYKMVDDVEFLELSALDTAELVLQKRATATPKGKQVTKYTDELRSWFDDAQNTTNRIVSEHGNTPIHVGLSEKTTYEKVVHHTLLQAQESDFHSYAARHGIWDEVMGNTDYASQLAADILSDFKKGR